MIEYIISETMSNAIFYLALYAWWLWELDHYNAGEEI